MTNYSQSTFMWTVFFIDSILSGLIIQRYLNILGTEENIAISDKEFSTCVARD